MTAAEMSIFVSGISCGILMVICIMLFTAALTLIVRWYQNLGKGRENAN